MRTRLTEAPWTRAAILGAVLLFLGLWSPGDVAAQKSGGTLRVAIIGEPPALDPHWTTAAITDIITKCLGTRNQVTVVKAAIKALSQLRTPQDVERLRGVSLT